jgi:hypothetical protein
MMVRASALHVDAAGEIVVPVALRSDGTELLSKANQLYRVLPEKYFTEFRDVSSPAGPELDLKIRIWPQHRPAIATIGVRKACACNHACPGEGWFAQMRQKLSLAWLVAVAALFSQASLKAGHSEFDVHTANRVRVRLRGAGCTANWSQPR